MPNTSSGAHPPTTKILRTILATDVILASFSLVELKAPTGPSLDPSGTAPRTPQMWWRRLRACPRRSRPLAYHRRPGLSAQQTPRMKSANRRRRRSPRHQEELEVARHNPDPPCVLPLPPGGLSPVRAAT